MGGAIEDFRAGAEIGHGQRRTDFPAGGKIEIPPRAAELTASGSCRGVSPLALLGRDFARLCSARGAPRRATPRHMSTGGINYFLWISPHRAQLALRYALLRPTPPRPARPRNQNRYLFQVPFSENRTNTYFNKRGGGCRACR